MERANLYKDLVAANAITQKNVHWKQRYKMFAPLKERQSTFQRI